MTGPRTESAGSGTGEEPSARHIMRPAVPTVTPATPVSAVARLLSDEGLTGVPVLEGDRLVGIITEWDIIAREAAVDVPPVIPFLDGMFRADGGRDFDEEMRHVFAITAADLMTSPVYSVRDIATLAEVATLMVERRISTVPVVDAANKIIGLVTRSDLVRVIAALESPST